MILKFRWVSAEGKKNSETIREMQLTNLKPLKSSIFEVENIPKRPSLEILTFLFLWEEMCISKLQKRIYQYCRGARNNQNVNNFPSLTTSDLLEHVARCREPCTATPRTEVQNRGMFLGHDSAFLANSMYHMLSFLGICH